VAFGTTAPVKSVTVPEMRLVVPCAKAIHELRNRVATKKGIFRSNITPPGKADKANQYGFAS
jgi:hypothetical protein